MVQAGPRRNAPRLPRQLAPAFEARRSQVLPGAGPTTVARQDANRVGLIVSVTDGNGIRVWPKSASGSAGGVAVWINGAPFHAKFSDIGGVVTDEWVASDVGVPSTLAVLEVLFYPERG